MWTPTNSVRGPDIGITDRRSEAAARPNDAVLARVQAHVLEAMGVVVIACDAALRIVAASPSARALLGGAERLPEALEAIVRGRGEPRVALAGRTYRVAAREIDPGWALWLRAEISGRNLDEALRRRWSLTRRQLDLVHQLRHGFRNQQIAKNLGLTHSTVKSYMSQLFDVLGVRSRTEAIAMIERLRRGEL